MARPPAFVCTACGTPHAKWAGQCGACGGWNTIEVATADPTPQGRPKPGKALPILPLAGEDAPLSRSATGLAEVDRVLGGGLVPGSAILVGGDPGIGKSTLLLQVAASVATAGHTALYVSGEEAAGQIRLRAARLDLAGSPLGLIAETGLGDILATIEAHRPALVIIDSIQTLWSEAVGSAPGSLAQVRGAAHGLVSAAKTLGTAIVLIGHVTKEGQIAGPRVVEHMVDTVLYFEGERGHQFRLLRAVKNRFGPAGEIGVFEMTGQGLAEVANPSALFLGERDQPVPGSAVFAGIEGTRPILVEIQALVAPSPLATPRRSVLGWDGGRLAMLLAVLEARAGIAFTGSDVYLNVAGGVSIREPAADLAVAAALVSAKTGTPLPPDLAIFGEVSLAGALRPVPQREGRLKEAAKLGFTAALGPPATKPLGESGVTYRGVATLAEVFAAGFGVQTSGPPGRGTLEPAGSEE